MGKEFDIEANQQLNLPAPMHAGQLMRVNPDAIPGSDAAEVGSGIAIRHGPSIIALPVGSSTEAIADLVKALNRHA